LVLTLAVGCSQSAQPAAQQEPPASQEPAQSAEAESVTSEEAKAEPVILEWSDWQAKMTGTINKDYFVLDLRTPDEIKMEKGLEGSINIDANETLAKGDVAIIEEKLATVPKDAVLLIHCKSGGRAKANAAKFIEAGFTNVFVLDGWTAFDNKGYFGASKIDSNTTHLKPKLGRERWKELSAAITLYLMFGIKLNMMPAIFKAL
jgi:rhodanese-related sulfurtransferase